MDYSLVLISRNRPAFLARFLRYYALQGARCPFYIGDASDGPQREEIQALARSFDRTLDLRITYYSATSPPMPRLTEEYAKVDTPLVAWVADDDFLTPGALDAGARALAEHRSASAFVGRAALFSVDGNGAFGPVKWFSAYPQRGYPESRASDRLIAYARDPVPLTYSLRRKEQAQAIMATVGAAAWPDDAIGYFFFEVLDGMLTVIGGEVMQTPALMMVRQSHATSYGASGLPERFNFRYLSSPGWTMLRDTMMEALVRALHLAEPSLADDLAHEAAERALWIRTSQTWRNLAVRPGSTADAEPGRVSLLDAWPFARLAYVNFKMLSVAGAASYGGLAEVRHLVEQRKAHA